MMNFCVQNEESGILPRVLAELLSPSSVSCSTYPDPPAVSLTFLEVYNEKVYDLLANTRSQLATGPDGGGGLRAIGAVERNVDSIAVAMKLVQEATDRRSVSATCLNAHSSRSHALVAVRVKSSVLWIVDKF